MTPICLITPPSVFLLDERVFPSLGILKVAACLEEAGHSVEMVDLSGIQHFEDAIRDHAGNTQCEIFGITATTPQMPACMKVVAAIREVRPKARIILGGPHITLINAAYKRELKLGINGRATRAFEKMVKVFDVLVAGDGEEAIFLAIAHNATKLIDADDPSSAMFLTNSRLNELPWPARHLVDMSSYRYSISEDDGVVSPVHSLIGQLGCPFACGFCGGRESSMLRRIRTRTPENIVAEVKHLHDVYGAKGAMLYDDELNLGKQMVPLMNLLGDLNENFFEGKFRLRGFIKSQLFTDEQAASMYRAGFRWILVGFESGSEEILEAINKKATRAENTRCMEIAKRHGIKVKALMSIGHPGESEATVMATRDWLLEVKPEDFDCTVISTYAGTPYHDWAVQTGDNPPVWTYTYQKTGARLHASEIDFSEQAQNYKGKPGEYVSYVWTDYLSGPDLVRLRDFVEADVRTKLGIPFNQSAVAMRYEHTMGQIGKLPPSILRTTNERCA